MEPKISVGDICYCRHGVRGIVASIKHRATDGVKVYQGFSLYDPCRKWESVDPSRITSVGAAFAAWDDLYQ